MFGLALHHSPFRQQCRLDGHGLDRANELSADRRIGATPTEGHTPARPDRGRDRGRIDRRVGRPVRCNYDQPTSAPAGIPEGRQEGHCRHGQTWRRPCWR